MSNDGKFLRQDSSCSELPAFLIVGGLKMVDPEDLAWYCVSLSKRIGDLSGHEIEYPNEIIDRMNEATCKVRDAVERYQKTHVEGN